MPSKRQWRRLYENWRAGVYAGEATFNRALLALGDRLRTAVGDATREALEEYRYLTELLAGDGDTTWRDSMSAQMESFAQQSYVEMLQNLYTVARDRTAPGHDDCRAFLRSWGMDPDSMAEPIQLSEAEVVALFCSRGMGGVQ